MEDTAKYFTKKDVPVLECLTTPRSYDTHTAIQQGIWNGYQKLFEPWEYLTYLSTLLSSGMATIQLSSAGIELLANLKREDKNDI